ncbi:MAG: hypothetical protein NC548_49865 [Lachnospiraceae bacterium]|nr:hypothetical protein [Lachnospiraceae bacterium]
MKNRLILSAIAIHCLVDFDLEFTAMWFLILLSWDMYHGKVINIAAGGKTAFYKILAGLLSAAALYTGIAMLPGYLGNARLSAALLPFYTEAKKEVLTQETDVSHAKQLTAELLQQNKYTAEAYDILAAAAYQQGDFLKMAEYKKESIALQKYNLDAYERYVVLLSSAIETVIADEDTQTLQILMQYVIDVDTRRKEV